MNIDICQKDSTNLCFLVLYKLYEAWRNTFTKVQDICSAKEGIKMQTQEKPLNSNVCIEQYLILTIFRLDIPLER